MKESSIDNLRILRDQKIELLTKTNHDIEVHQKRKHKGLPATSCHKCLNYQQELLNLHDLIERYNRMLGEE